MKFIVKFLIVVSFFQFFFASQEIESLVAAIQCTLLWRVEKIVTNNPTIVDMRDSVGLTPLVCAVFSDKVDICNLLLQNGADLNIKHLPYSVLHVAKSSRVMECLLQAGADINAKDKRGHTPLECAMYGRQLCKIEFLIKQGAYLNQDMLQIFEKKFDLGLFDYADDSVKLYYLEKIKALVQPYIFYEEKVEEIKAQTEEQEIIEKIECLICMEFFCKKIIKIIPCFNNTTPKHEHAFLCGGCLDKIKKQSNTCPLCRALFNKEKAEEF
jgi:hypothetical protein